MRDGLTKRWFERLQAAATPVKSQRGAKEATLLRAELLSVEQLKRAAVELAGEHRVIEGGGANRLLKRLDDNVKALRVAYNIILAADGAGRRLLPAEEWILDNFYLIEQQIELVRIHLPRRYSRRLPLLTSGSDRGLPRVYSLVAFLTAHLDGLLDLESTSAFVDSYQSRSVLKLGELWAVPITLRLALIKNLRLTANLVAQRRLQLDSGIEWAKRFEEAFATNPRLLLPLLAELAEEKQELTAPFLAEFTGRLRDHSRSMALVLNWVEQTLAEESTTVAQRMQQDGRHQAAEQLSVTNSISSLRFLDSVDWQEFVERQSKVEAILRQDPLGAYAQQDFATRDHYRHIVERLATTSGLSEVEVARQALECAAGGRTQPDCQRARHVGSYLVGGHRFEFRKRVGCKWTPRYAFALLLRRYRLFFYLCGVFALCFGIAFLPPWGCSFKVNAKLFWLFATVAFLPATSLALSLINFLVTLKVDPHPLPRLDFSDGIPQAHRTMVVLPVMLTSPGSIDNLLERLEIHYLANRDKNLQFALLSDFADAHSEVTPTDAALLERAQKGVEALNRRYRRESGVAPFHLFHRPRLWNEREGIWMAYERKRGKLLQFNHLLRNQGHENFSLIVGDQTVLATVRYVITLDADTDLPRGAAQSLVGALAHPLNRPRYDATCGRIVEGYAILQPRVSIRLTSANQSFYTKLYCGDTGFDPYSREVSDVYQDLFSEGSFVGKGIYDVDAFNQALESRFPDNLILSHDLIESAYARSGLLGYVEVYEEMPLSYLGEISRQHRWMRGDWQLLRWLGRNPPTHEDRHRTCQPVSYLLKWKILDNLRRSLFAPAMLLMLLLGWFHSATTPFCWTAYALLVLGLSGVVRSATLLLRKPRDRGFRIHLRVWVRRLARHLGQPLFALAVVPYEAFVALNAIARSALRMPFTRRGLLNWHLPQYRRLSKTDALVGYIKEMWAAPLVGAVVTYLIWIVRPATALSVMPVTLLWILAPLAAWLISRPIVARTQQLTRQQRRMLHKIACRTWLFFDTFITDQESWLPPDNFQEIPEPMIASRTSPTNIAFGLTTCLTAVDFGYLAVETMLERVTKMFESIARLERYRGHLFNWYDTRTLAPLAPRYVSSVDSGNLCAGVVALQSGLQEICDMPLDSAVIWRGLQDIVMVLSEEAAGRASSEFVKLLEEAELSLVVPPTNLERAYAQMGEFEKRARQLAEMALSERLDGVVRWSRHLFKVCRDHVHHSLPFIQTGDAPLTLRQLARGGSEGAIDSALAQRAGKLVQQATDLTERCTTLLEEMQYDFLYNQERKLLHIGFNVDSRRIDPSFYDLLASEARIASYLMIAHNQAPAEHWFALGRLLVGRGGQAALVSWSGSIFEYLMPDLLMRSYPGTLLDRSNHAAVERQIRYGKQRNVPWGISESCYNATDSKHVYQYRAFGVPGLGLKRGLSEDLVVAPYASLMALPFNAPAACSNLERLIKDEGALGDYGLYEAIDYTATRLPRGKQRVVIRSFMAHHQGMGLLALSHLLLGAPMVRRFMANPEVRAAEMLLQERVPDVTPVVHPHQHEATSKTFRESGKVEETVRFFKSPLTPVPAVQLLSNNTYHLMVSNAGGSMSRWREVALTRWREDFTCDNWGTYLYLRDIKSNKTLSNTYHPLQEEAQIDEAIFSQGRAEYRRRLHDLEVQTEICVSPEDDVEIRRVTLNNFARHAREFEITSYAEIVLAPLAADLAHRVFNNLFVMTEVLPRRGIVLATRRRRSAHEPELWYFQCLSHTGAADGVVSCESDREKFLGRGRTTRNPVALEGRAGEARALSNSAGFVLDPIAAVRLTLSVSTDSLHQLVLVSGVAATRTEALALAEKYRDRHFVDRAFDMAWSHCQILMRQLQIGTDQVHVYERLAASMLYANRRNRAPWPTVARNKLGQQALWRFGISGDLPTVLLRVSDIRRMELVHEVLRAHAYWRRQGLTSDLIILNEDFSGYRATLNEQILAAIATSSSAELLDRPGGIFPRRLENLSEDDLILFQSVARVVLTDGPENLREQVERRQLPHRMSAELKPSVEIPAPEAAELPQLALVFDNGLGGFSRDGREYIITLKPGVTTPAPWSNVIAGKRLGMVVSESGGIYTWVDNAHEYRLTTWHNDPVSDQSAEAFYLRDEESGEYWSLAAAPAAGSTGYVCRHGFGYTIFAHEERQLRSEMRIFAAIDDPIRCVTIRLSNHSTRTREVSLTTFHELVLGEWRHDNAMHVTSEVDSLTGQLLVRNPYSRVYPQRVVFATCSEDDFVVCGDRTEFIGRNGSLAQPAAMRRERLSGRTGARYDPAACLQTFKHLAPGEHCTIVFTLGAADSEEEARKLYGKYGKPAGAAALGESVAHYWSRLLSRVQVEVPAAPEINFLTNGWLLYQTLSCRLWGRSGYYQSSGAFGFRDQLQDAMALVHAAPELLRQQILLCAARQFPAGDVQHWWHPPTGAGVRTRIVDDRLWLPQAVARYVTLTGDAAILDESVPFLDGRTLDDGEESRYEQHSRSNEEASLYEHCLRAIRVSMQYGRHGLPLIGGGDWNDGFDKVGLEGRGESVWMGWFLCDTLRRFEAIAALRGDRQVVDLCRHERQALAAKIEEHAWDGAWYRRAYFDDGTPVGSSECAEGTIDAISQSWAILSRVGRTDRAHQALESLKEHLVDREAGIIQLLTPPFNQSEKNPGYIKSYPPGIRENGAQYTHAAIWSIMALAQSGDHESAWQLVRMINPINHSRTVGAAQCYRNEPYVLSADIYSVGPYVGRAGWSWYTGGAGWMYRLIVETLLGFKCYPAHLEIRPRLPSTEVMDFKLTYRHREDVIYEISVSKVRDSKAEGLYLDGAPLSDQKIPLFESAGVYQVEVVL